MICKLTMMLVSECQEGNVGEDWKYDLHYETFGAGEPRRGSISVARHNLPSGVVREPYGSPAPEELFIGECAGPLQVRLRLTVTEVDLLVNDVGMVQKDLTIECPGTAGGAETKELDIEAEVREAPAILPGKAVFTLRVRVKLSCS